MCICTFTWTLVLSVCVCVCNQHYFFSVHAADPPSSGNAPLIIAVSLAVPLIVLLITVTLVVVIVIVCVRRQRIKRKRFTPMSVLFNDKQFVLNAKEFGGREQDDKSKLLLCSDTLEFPRNKLFISDTPLGESLSLTPICTL